MTVVDRELARSDNTNADECRSVESSVGKAVSVLRAFNGDGFVGVSEIARRAGIPKSTTHRLLGELLQRGLVARHEGRYTLGVGLFELGTQVPFGPSHTLRTTAMPYLQELWWSTHETVHFAVPDGTEVLYLHKIHGLDAVYSPARVGSRMPAYCTGVGKAMLAYDDEATTLRQVLAHGLIPLTRYTQVVPKLFLEELRTVRKQGVAFDRQEARQGLVCVAAPVRDGDRVIAAVSLSGSHRKFEPEQHARTVKRVAFQISSALKADAQVAD